MIPPAIKATIARFAGSITIWWSVAIEVMGQVVDNFDLLAAVALDPTITQQVQAWIGGDPHMLALWMKVVGGITFAARAKSLIKTAKAA